MAVATESSLRMRPSDLIKKDHLGSGAFGDVYLCYHVTLGQVVMKTLYTGYLGSSEKTRLLMEEGNIMAKLNHERVVKLLGIIIEDHNCSLVMELMPRGNLWVMLERVRVPLSVKGRIILELLEGLVYLTQKFVLHKDIKPDNILVDKDFHIKIADLGLATCQTWTKLTKEESHRRSRLGKTAGVRGAGTLSYMAPEHLESIHNRSTEKSDVYSFAIVIWVILTGQEPYANARNEDQIVQCVRNGDRPLQDSVPYDTPKAIVELMVKCWDPKPENRPTFQKSYDDFFTYYTVNLEPCVEKDVQLLKQLYEGPEELVQKLRSLHIGNEYLTQDSPSPLLSTQRPVSMPTEMSVDDLESSIQTDARATRSTNDLEEKLNRELQYHRHGSYMAENQFECANGLQRSSSNHSLQRQMSTPNNAVRPTEQDTACSMSSVQTWSKVPLGLSSQEGMKCPQAEDDYDLFASSSSTPSQVSMSASSISQTPLPQSQFHRQKSWTAHPVNETAAPEGTCGRLLSSSRSISLQESTVPSLYIKHARGVQIGSNNTLHLNSSGSPFSSACGPSSSMAFTLIKDDIKIHEDCPVYDKHFDYLVEHMGNSWKRCARRLGFSKVDIEKIEYDNRHDRLEELVHQMFKRWEMREGRVGCTMGRLCYALEDLVNVEVIQHILINCH
ncbi:receptor-interacting serine/threonine-protein kinase 1 [Synchiropus splendidus]|uniref:receptor-interacting serine/threonine-protein kinase 1 n=1 Tax=Synchiropus splendidus TaxID=270530 RepID=UPI00237DB255|nr:receptor-interacting serine/threonine-protein kinase 1 [Synchiropus splendidus]XP_053739526.1 receptor-interacting serine/threonine-protein kinase 1 [Synchiropus splendidus]